MDQRYFRSHRLLVRAGSRQERQLVARLEKSSQRELLETFLKRRQELVVEEERLGKVRWEVLAQSRLLVPARRSRCRPFVAAHTRHLKSTKTY